MAIILNTLSIMMKFKFTLLFSICGFVSFGQNDAKFKTTQEYLTFLEKKFDIDRSNVYQYDAYNDSTYLGKYSSVIFLKGTKIATMEDVRNIDQNICPPKKFFLNLSLNAIEKAFQEDNKLTSIFFKNLNDNSIVENTGETIAIFLFTHKVGHSGLRYYKQRELLEKLNIKCFLVTGDEYEIADLRGPDSTEVIINK